jgi:hypothetical protein
MNATPVRGSAISPADVRLMTGRHAIQILDDSGSRPELHRTAKRHGCESGIVGIRRMDHQLERTAVAESNGREVPHIACGQTTDAE